MGALRRGHAAPSCQFMKVRAVRKLSPSFGRAAQTDHFALVTTAVASLGAGNELLAHDHFAIYLPHGINPALAGPSASWEAGLFGAAESILCQHDAVCVLRYIA